MRFYIVTVCVISGHSQFVIFWIIGKKASVITFGSEWQNMTAEDRLRRNKSTQSGTGAEGDSITVADSESMSSLAFPSRRASQQVQPTYVRGGDELTVPQLPVTLPTSRRGSHTGQLVPVSGKDEELPGVPEDLNVPGAREKLIVALNGVKSSAERNSMVLEPNGTSTE